MIFNSLSFAIFLPIVLVGYYFLTHKNQNRFLLLSSLVFYAWWDWRFLGLLAITILTDYFVALAIAKSSSPVRRKRLLWLSLGSNLGVLGLFKYGNFFVSSFSEALHSAGFQVNPVFLKLALPIGISFYTFMSMAYVIDVYWRKIQPVTEFSDFALFVSYFPHLVAGPILRANQLLPQIRSERHITKDQIREGFCLILIGYARKVLIADLLASTVDDAFSNVGGMTSADLVFRLWLCAIQIYGDFAGYSDIARGVSKLFGIELDLNFATPLFSQNITEFWRRWHISLSSWLRDYVYIPLGGNRRGSARTYFNNLVTMLVSGLWHGANWTFIVFGLVHGIALTLHKVWLSLTGDTMPRGYGTRTWNVWTPLKIFLTFNLFSFSLILFRSPSFSVGWEYLSRIASLTPGIHVGSTLFVIPFICIALILDGLQYTGYGQRILAQVSPGFRAICFGLLFGLILIAGSDNSRPFVYFQF